MNTLINIADISIGDIPGAAAQKAVLAMQATKYFVEGEDQKFQRTNVQLLTHAGRYALTPSMTYEDVALQNTQFVLSDDPAVAESEAYFYGQHRRIERHLKTATDALDASVHDETAAAAVHAAADEVKTLYDCLPTKDFAAFRPYFVGLNGNPGPSGLYSAAMPVLDLAAHGLGAMAHSEQKRITEALRQGLYPCEISDEYVGVAHLQRLLSSRNPQLLADGSMIQNDVTEALNRFRRMHHGAVRKYVPDALTGAAGTGGVSEVAVFLRSKIRTQTRSA